MSTVAACAVLLKTTKKEQTTWKTEYNSQYDEHQLRCVIAHRPVRGLKKQYIQFILIDHNLVTFDELTFSIIRYKIYYYFKNCTYMTMRTYRRCRLHNNCCCRLLMMMMMMVHIRTIENDSFVLLSESVDILLEHAKH